LGIKAESIGIKKKATTHKGKKMMELKAPKLIENPKRSIMIKGSKCSNELMSLIKDLHLIRGADMSKLFLRKSHDIHPFDEIGPLEQMSVR
jgi:ribosome production factor 2